MTRGCAFRTLYLQVFAETKILSCETETAAALRGAGQKVTPQRMLILCSVRHAHGHVSASQILQEVRRSYPYVDASTVYRTLAAARDLRLVSEANMGSGDTLFEWMGTDKHHHLVCRVCGEVSSLDPTHLDAVAAEVLADDGFAVDLDHFTLFGVCRECRTAAEGAS